MNLLREWANWSERNAPFVLKLDEHALLSERNSRRIISRGSWDQAYRAADFCAPKDSRLHLGLLPQPFLGDLRRASIYILGLNPGLGPGDYYAEYEVPRFKRALLLNLKQKSSRHSVPFLFLDPQYAWHGGFGWWHAKLAKVISHLAEKTWGVPLAHARARLAGKLASIELVPYHSLNFASYWTRHLPSVALARNFVHDVVLAKVRRGDAIVVALRRAGDWNLPKHPGIVTYGRKQARAASLSPESKGGKAILRHLSNF